ncbi:MAG: hypothetical protein IPK79_03905 [Vampirovibrionales bacterium]|nr:hypothetical protein [Vampirovibrionales bacterium]
MKQEEVRLGYLLIASPIPNVYIGGAMVTDGRGLPIEFRYTEPIQPTKIQQILYGQALGNYIKGEVILETIVKSLESAFSLLLVEDEKLLNCPSKTFTVVRVSETKTPKIGDPGDWQRLTPYEILAQVSREGNPLRLQLSSQHAGESADDDAASETPPLDLELLALAGQSMELTEPLRRIERALESICQEAGLRNDG